MEGSTTRRRHSAQFKAQVLAECAKPGVSIAGVALAHGINANLLRKWIVGRGLKGSGLEALREVRHRPAMAACDQARDQVPAALGFVPLALPATATTAPAEASSAAAVACDAQPIRVEVRRGTLSVKVSWPSGAAAECGAWLREVLR